MFPEVFLGLERPGKPYAMKLNPDAKSFCLKMPWQIPLPLKKAAQLELKSMEEQSVIFCVKKPIDWCSGMVIVLKFNEKVCICVDYTKLNKNVCSELHM